MGSESAILYAVHLYDHLATFCYTVKTLEVLCQYLIVAQEIIQTVDQTVRVTLLHSINTLL